MDSKQERKCSHRLFATTQLLHVAKTLHRRHSIEFQSAAVGLLGVIEAQVCLPAQWMLAASCHVGVDRLESFVNMVEGIIEEFDSLDLDSLELLSCLGRSLSGLFVVGIAFLQTLRRRSESLASLPLCSAVK